MYIKLSVCLSDCLSVCTYWHTGNSAVSAQIEMGGSHSLFLQAYSTHHSSTGVPRRQRCKQPLTHKATGLWISPTIDIFYFC